MGPHAHDPPRVAVPRVVVAFSGGLDSSVLLHLLRFACSSSVDVVAAHLDHGMRPGSGRDADWVRGVCRAWDVPLVTERVTSAPGSENEARTVRYDFLERARVRLDARWVFTAHHADDQAETVLFRVLRGTGLDGLAGIPTERSPGIARPLLAFWREELEAYASAVGLSWRDDPSNRTLRYTRNRLRHEILPEVERTVGPAARRSLVRLAGLANENERAWGAVLPDILARLEPSDERRGRSFDRAGVVAMPPPLRARVLRRFAEEAGVTLNASATERAVDFVASGRSGAGIELGRGAELRRELDRLLFLRPARPLPADDREVRIDGPGQGEEDGVIGGQVVSVRWRPVDSGRTSDPAPADTSRAQAPSGDASRADATRAHTPPLDASRTGAPEFEACFRVGGLHFPLAVRPRRPGDAIRFDEGSRKLKEVLLDARIPSRERSRIPLLADARGDVLWVPGLVRVPESCAEDAGGSLSIRIDRSPSRTGTVR